MILWTLDSLSLLCSCRFSLSQAECNSTLQKWCVQWTHHFCTVHCPNHPKSLLWGIQPILWPHPTERPREDWEREEETGACSGLPGPPASCWRETRRWRDCASRIEMHLKLPLSLLKEPQSNHKGCWQAGFYPAKRVSKPCKINWPSLWWGAKRRSWSCGSPPSFLPFLASVGVWGMGWGLRGSVLRE